MMSRQKGFACYLTTNVPIPNLRSTRPDKGDPNWILSPAHSRPWRALAWHIMSQHVSDHPHKEHHQGTQQGQSCTRVKNNLVFKKSNGAQIKTIYEYMTSINKQGWMRDLY